MSDIVHDLVRHRFTLETDGHEAELVYQLEPGRIAIVHTGVPEAIGGRGIAAELVRTALEYARAQGVKVVPRCAYAEAFFKKHREYGDLLE